MEPNQSSPGTISKTAISQNSPVGVASNQNRPAMAPSPEAVARRAYAIYEQQGSQPGHEAKHWREAEAELFGGIEHESQMHPGSSLFTTEH